MFLARLVDDDEPTLVDETLEEMRKEEHARDDPDRRKPAASGMAGPALSSEAPAMQPLDRRQRPGNLTGRADDQRLLLALGAQ
ncbi:hypothetical protein GCM10028812_10540 [Ancylobacter sonchi]